MSTKTIEYKAVGVTEIGDPGDGRVTALVAITGVKDNVNDIILPGAFEKSLKDRMPKGIWHHDWKASVAKTEAIKELLPGDPALPDTLANGKPWPRNAGALSVDMQFNLKTERGRDAYEDVKFFGADAQWSIGYNVPTGGATKDSRTGTRSISQMDLYEYSPVLHGAMPLAHTLSVKDAQEKFIEIKSLHGDDAQAFLLEMKSLIGDDAVFGIKQRNWDDDDETENWDGGASDDDDSDPQDDMEDDGDDDDESSAIDRAIRALEDLRDGKRGHKSVLAVLADEAEFVESVQTKAAEFDAAVADEDAPAVAALADDLLLDIEAGKSEGIDEKALTAMVNHIITEMKGLKKKPFPDDDDDERETADPAPADDDSDVDFEDDEPEEDDEDDDEVKSMEDVVALQKSLQSVLDPRV